MTKEDKEQELRAILDEYPCMKNVYFVKQFFPYTNYSSISRFCNKDTDKQQSIRALDRLLTDCRKLKNKFKEI